MTIFPHLFMSLMSVSPYFITRNSTFSLSQYWFFLIFVTGGTNYIIFPHVWSFLDQFLTREAYFSNLITSVCYANHVSISTPAWGPSIGMVTDPWPFIMSSLVKIRPKMRPRTLTNREISQKLPNRDSCDYRTVTPTYGHHPHPTTIHHTKFGWDPT